MTRIALVVAAFGLMIGGCSAAPSTPQGKRETPCLLVPQGHGPLGEVPIRVDTVVTGLEVPWAIAFLPGGDWLITERPGRVRLVTGGKLVAEPVLTLDVVQDGEGGLLGIAASPQFQVDRAFYVYATFQEGGRHDRVLRYRLSEDHRSAELDKVIIDRIPASKGHDGGRLRFGPDGMLYVAAGDAPEPARSPPGTSQGGKLLRLTREGNVPADNPHGPNNPVFLSGLRNCQGFDWYDPRFVAVLDHGPGVDLGLSEQDEVHVAVSGLDLGGADYRGCQSIPGKVAPALVWREAVSPAGAAIYTGGLIPEWTGSLLIGTLESKHLHRIVFNPQDPRMVRLHEVYLPGDPPAGHGRLREVVMGPGSMLYVTTSNCDGRGECPPDKDRVLRISR